MIKRIQLTKEQALNAIANGEFPNEVTGSKNRVAIILTQDWCPQWLFMKTWVYDIEIDEDVDIYELVYNKVEFFNEFMEFKEKTLKNYSVPYVRFYKNGSFSKHTNYIGKQEFKILLED